MPCLLKHLMCLKIQVRYHAWSTGTGELSPPWPVWFLTPCELSDRLDGPTTKMLLLLDSSHYVWVQQRTRPSLGHVKCWRIKLQLENLLSTWPLTSRNRRVFPLGTRFSWFSRLFWRPFEMVRDVSFDENPLNYTLAGQNPVCFRFFSVQWSRHPAAEDVG